MTPEFGPEMVTPWSATRLSVKNSVDEQPIHDVTALGAPQSVYNGGLLREFAQQRGWPQRVEHADL